MGAMRFIGMRFISRAAMPGRVVITHAHWIGCICGKRCAIRRVEPGARRLGEGGGSVGVVQRGSALRSGIAERGLRFGAMAESWTASAWRQYLAAGEMESKLTEIRRCTHTGRPLGSAEFVQALEGTMKPAAGTTKGRTPSQGRFGCETSELAFESE